ncbi:MAG: hypothetical protein HKL90_01215 [Elusimicrobia bacterium]|nr:hypothetical protein [Elusimicrobiota bacterium]
MARGLPHLRKVVARLVSPRGCPWDKVQTHKTLIPFLREEAKELEDALAGGRWHEIEDELGDILFHVFLHAKLAQKDGHFSLDDVAESQAVKLERRHPHVFKGDRTFSSPEEVLAHWKTIKAAERAQRARDVAARERGAKARRARKAR